MSLLLLPDDLVNFDANVSPKVSCWRLVHDGTNVIGLFESAGETITRYILYCGTKEECDGEIARLGLVPLPD